MAAQERPTQIAPAQQAKEAAARTAVPSLPFGRRGRGPVASATGRVRWAPSARCNPHLTPALSAPPGQRGRDGRAGKADTDCSRAASKRSRSPHCTALSALRAEREGTRRFSDGEGEVGAVRAWQSPPHPGPLRPLGAEREVWL